VHVYNARVRRVHARVFCRTAACVARTIRRVRRATVSWSVGDDIRPTSSTWRTPRNPPRRRPTDGTAAGGGGRTRRMSGGRTPTGPAGDREHGRRVRSGTRDRTSTARGLRLAAASPARVPVMGWRDPAVSHGSTQPRVPPGSHDRVPVLLHAAGNVGPAGRRLCDPVWHVRSRCGQTGRCTPVYFPCVAESHRRRSGPTTRRSARNTLRVSFTASPRRCGGGHGSARPTVDVEISRYSDSMASDGDARRKCEDSCGDGRASIVSAHSQQRRDRRTHLTTTVSRAVYTM